MTTFGICEGTEVAAELNIDGSVLSGVGLVVFDKDGTLIDVHAYWANMVRLRSDIMGRRLNLSGKEISGLMEAMGVDVDRMRVKRTGPVGIKRRDVVLRAGADYLHANGFGDQRDALVDAFAETDRLSVARLDELIQPIDGLYALVNGLVACGCRVAVATTDRTDRATLALRHLKIASSIDFVAGADIVNAPKPAPDILHLVCERLGVLVEHTVMVGDSVCDVQAGVNAGCQASVGVTSGLTEAQELREITPLVVRSIADITVACSPSIAE